MRVLFFTDNFPPESNAPAIRTFEHCRYWASQGAEVTIITGVPNFPDGKVSHGYHNRWRQIEIIDGIRVVRVKTYITANKGFFRRTVDYLSFMVSGFAWSLVEKRPNVVIGTSPQFFCAWAAYFYSVCKRCPFVMEVRDLWPDSIVEVGVLRDGFIARLLRLAEKYIYRRASLVVTVTESFKTHVMSLGIEESSVCVITNGANLEVFSTSEKRAETNERRRNVFRVGYIGTLGMAHGLGCVLEAAALLAERKSATQISFTGAGADREYLIESAKELGLSNVEFRPQVGREQVAEEWDRLDAGLVVLKNKQVFATVIPSKIFEGMASGIPLIISVPSGEATKIVNHTGIGICVTPESSQELADAIMDLENSPSKRLRMKRAALDNAYRFDRNYQAEKMYGVLKRVSFT